MRILIVEDEKKVADFIKRGLKEEGYSVDVAYDGEEGHFLVTTNEYDIIILDIMLPKIDGITLCKELTGAYFFDVGGLWSRPNKFSFEDLKCGTGFGLRYITKWGVARIDYGIRLTHDKDESRSRIHVSFGIPF